ncbi:MAG: hypothetical protein ACLQVL_17595 [Terriglobia bacterium]
MPRTDSVLVQVLHSVVITAMLVSGYPSRCLAIPPANGGASPDAPALQIVVLQGEDGVNIIKKKIAVKPVVEIRDKNKLPVAAAGAGVAVVFLLEGKDSAKFANGKTSASVVTDANGRAVAPDFRPIRQGSYAIEIRASYQFAAASRTIAQVNFKTVAAAQKAGKVPGSSHGDAQAQAASHGANPASSAASAGTATSTAAAGHTALIVGGIAAGAAAVGGVAAYEALNKSSSTNCSNLQNLLNQEMSDLNTEESVCQTGTVSQCEAAAQRVLNDAGQACSCAGGVPSGDQSLFSQLQQIAAELGLAWPSACD